MLTISLPMSLQVRRRVKKILPIISHACLLGTSFPGFAATLLIEIHEQQESAPIHAALYQDAQTDWSDPPIRLLKTRDGILKFEDLPPGRYAIQVFQDTNDNGKLDSTRRGLPTEPVGFSGNPPLVNRKPKIEECWIELIEPVAVEHVYLRLPRPGKRP